MRRILWVLPLLVLVPLARSADNEPPKGFTSLLNGKDLEGWKVMGGKKDVWGVEKGTLFVSGVGVGASCWPFIRGSHPERRSCSSVRLGTSRAVPV